MYPEINTKKENIKKVLNKFVNQGFIINIDNIRRMLNFSSEAFSISQAIVILVKCVKKMINNTKLYECMAIDKLSTLVESIIEGKNNKK